MPEYVYILADHEEYGSSNCIVTRDRNKLATLLTKNWSDGNDERRSKYINECLIALNNLLQRSDEELCFQGNRSGIRLDSGWGGIQLFVLEIET